jgi:iron complex outermembrane receptor protein
MKRTCLQKNTDTDEQNTCEFHPDKISLREYHYDPREIQQVKSYVQMKFKSVKLRMVMFLLSFALLQTAVAQQKTITGKVSAEETGEPLIGVTIAVKGTTMGTITNIDGQYTISATKGQTLVFSFVGYQSAEAYVGDQAVINMVLSQSTEDLGEVVVIGYGQVKKKDVTGSVASVTAESMNKGVVASPQDLIVGKIAGVQITSGSGAPGSGSQIRIRGGSSLNASNDPLIVIDGVPIDNDGISGTRNFLSTLNPNDIESFNVLKDASATAIFGARASNGVILITTKKGKEGAALKISYDGKASVGTIVKTKEALSSEQFKTIVNERGTALHKSLLGNADTDWQKEIYQLAFGHDHFLTATGSLSSMPYRASVGYSDQRGVLKTSGMNRFTGSLGLSPTFFDKHLKVDVNLKGSIENHQFADEGAIGSALSFDPTQPVMSGNDKYGGYWEWVDPATGEPNTLAPRNPLALLMMRDDLSTVMRSIGNVQFDYKFHFLPELRANLNMGYDVSRSEGTVDVPQAAASNFNSTHGGGVKNTYEQSKRNRLFDFYLNYVNNFPTINSRIDAMAGYSYQNFYREGSNRDSNVAGTIAETREDEYASEYTLISFFGRLNYTFADRYLLTLTLRNDGSSRFSPDNRWGLFPSAAFAWRIVDEPFMKGQELFYDLKLRLGAGVTGQQDVTGNDYPYMARYTYSEDNARYQFGNSFFTTLRPEGYDRNIKWEETMTYNVGLDYGFLKGRVYGTIDLYQKTTKDLLNKIPVAAGTNLTNELLTNVGSIENKGLEFSINAIPFETKDFSWDLGFNMTLNRNEITKLTATNSPDYKGVAVGGISGAVGIPFKCTA